MKVVYTVIITNLKNNLKKDVDPIRSIPVVKGYSPFAQQNLDTLYHTNHDKFLLLRQSSLFLNKKNINKIMYSDFGIQKLSHFKDLIFTSYSFASFSCVRERKKAQ